MIQDAAQSSSFGRVGRAVAVLMALLLLPPCIILAVAPILLLMLPMAAIAIPMMMLGFCSAALAPGSKALAGGASRISGVYRTLPPRRASWLFSLLFLSACAASTPGTNTGSTGALASAGAGALPDSAGSMCSSDTYWTQGDRESALMHPGGACIDCHARGEGPRFTVAGTVYPTAHEPLDCDGVGGGNDVHIQITDAAGTTLTMTVNAAGNFYSTAAIVFPFHAKVVTLGQERAMGVAQMTGDCNGCHTETGQNGAPGRIMLP